MTPSPTRILRSTWLALALLVGVRVVGDVLRLLRNPQMFSHSEEGYNAAVGLAIGNAGMLDQVLHLQYRAFCGGCTAVALAGAPLLGVAGDHWLAWKAVAMIWGAATLLVAFAAVDRWAGRAAAWFTAALLAMPIPGLRDVSLYLWGNHQETNLLVLAGVALLPVSPILAGVMAGFSLWFCRIAAYGLLATVLLGLVFHKGWRRLHVLVGAGLGLLPFLLPVAQDYAQYPLRTREMVPILEPLRALERLAELVDAAPSFVPAFKAPGVPYGIAVAVVLVSVALIIAHARRHPWRAALLAFPLAFAGGWASSPYHIIPGAGVISARYHTPWWMWWTVLAGVAAGLVWEKGGRRRWLALALVLPLPLSAAWVELSRPIGLMDGVRIGIARARTLPASDPAVFAHVAVPRLRSGRLGEARARDPVFDATLRRMEGLALGLDVRRQDRTLDEALAIAAGRDLEVVRGLGTGLVGEEWDTDSVHRANLWLSTLDPEVAAALGYGMGGGLAPNLLRVAPYPEAMDPVGTHNLLTGGDPTCPLCAAQGWLAVAACGGGRAEPPCLETWLLEPGREQALEGIGAAVADLPRPEFALRRLQRAWELDDLRAVDRGMDQPIYELNTSIRAPLRVDPLPR